LELAANFSTHLIYQITNVIEVHVKTCRRNFRAPGDCNSSDLRRRGSSQQFARGVGYELSRAPTFAAQLLRLPVYILSDFRGRFPRDSSPFGHRLCMRILLSSTCGHVPEPCFLDATCHAYTHFRELVRKYGPDAGGFSLTHAPAGNKVSTGKVSTGGRALSHGSFCSAPQHIFASPLVAVAVGVVPHTCC